MVEPSSPPLHHEHLHPARTYAPYALVLSGGVSRRGKLEGQFTVSNTTWVGEPVALNVCYRGFERHLFQPNGGVQNFNVFIHSWAHQEESWLRQLYRPVVAEFEDNGPHEATFAALQRRHRECFDPHNNDCKGRVTFLSQKYSLGRALQSLRAYEHRHNHTHSMVVMTRPDLLLLGRVILLSDSARFPPDEVRDISDLYFVTSSRNALLFGELYNRCWRDDLGGPGCVTDSGSHVDGLEISNAYFVLRVVTPGKPMRSDTATSGETLCIDVALIRKLCQEDCVARWTGAGRLSQLRAVGFDEDTVRGMHGEERCVGALSANMSTKAKDPT